MQNRKLTETFETLGDWYLPESTDRVITGKLLYELGRTEIQLLGTLLSDLKKINPSQNTIYPVIHGISQQGEAMTLFNAMKIGNPINMSSGGVKISERLISNSLLFGQHVFPDQTYISAQVNIPGLQIWLPDEVIEAPMDSLKELRNTGRNYLVKLPQTEKVRVEKIKSFIEWGYGYREKVDSKSSISVSINAWISIIPDRPQSISWFLDQQRKVTSLLSFLAGTSMSSDSIEVSISKEHQYHVSVMSGFTDTKTCSFKNPHDFFMLCNNMGQDFGSILNNWFNSYEEIETPSKLGLSVISSENIWLHIKFLSFMQALEGFHRSMFDGNYMSEDDYKPIRSMLSNAIPESVQPDHKEALKARFKYGYEISLRKRLTDLASKLSGPIQKLLFGKFNSTLGQWVDTRNYYTHWDENSKPDILNDQEMYDATIRMELFLRVLYLDLAGISQDKILESLNNFSKISQHLIQINKSANIDSDSSNKSNPKTAVDVIIKGDSEKEKE